MGAVYQCVTYRYRLANASDTPVVLMKLNRFVIRGAYLLVEIPNRVRVNHEQKYAEGKMRFHAEMYCTAGESFPEFPMACWCNGSLDLIHGRETHSHKLNKH